MAKAGDFLLLRKHSFDMLDWIGAGAVNRFQDVEHSFVGASMQGPLEASDGRGGSGMHVGKRGRCDPGGERGCVEFVVSVQNERNVQRAFRGLRRLGAIQLKKKIAGVRE